VFGKVWLVSKVVHLGYDSVGVNQKARPARPSSEVVVGCPRNSVRLANGPFCIRQKQEWKVLFISEGLLLFNSVKGSAQDSNAGGFKVWGSVTEPLSFNRSTRSRGFWVPPQQNPLPCVITERNFLGILIKQSKGWCRNSSLKHSNPPKFAHAEYVNSRQAQRYFRFHSFGPSVSPCIHSQ